MPKVTLAEEVRSRLEMEILSGVHRPEVHLDEAVQARRIGWSRTPLREALNQLVAVGLLVRKGHSGVSVAPFQQPALVEQVEVHAELEAACAGLAAQRMPMAMRADLDRLDGDFAAMMVLVRRGCGNHSLASLAAELERRIKPFHPPNDHQTGSCDRKAARALAQAIAKSDSAAAARAVRNRLMGSVGAAAIRFLKSGDGDHRARALPDHAGGDVQNHRHPDIGEPG